MLLAFRVIRTLNIYMQTQFNLRLCLPVNWAIQQKLRVLSNSIKNAKTSLSESSFAHCSGKKHPGFVVRFLMDLHVLNLRRSSMSADSQLASNAKSIKH